jgi:hypothetical protein
LRGVLARLPRPAWRSASAARIGVDERLIVEKSLRRLWPSA